jgi:hypothetical protein
MATAVVNGIRMHYRRIGEGSPIVLLHGWPQTGYAWRHVADDLAADHTVIVPDLRGYNPNVRRYLAHSHTAPAEILEWLTRGEDDAVRQTATETFASTKQMLPRKVDPRIRRSASAAVAEASGLTPSSHHWRSSYPPASGS